MTENYTAYERFLIAKKEYDSNIGKGKPVEIGDEDNPKTIGTVRKVLSDETGLNGYVIESLDKREVSVIYEGSKEPLKKGSKADWIDNDFPVAKNIITGQKEATPQLKSAAKTLNKVLKDYPNAKVSVYGHSLGSMDAQYALANVSDVNRIAGAYVYEGPNVYPILTEEQRATADALKYRIHNYVDQKDIVSLGYPQHMFASGVDLTSRNAIGIVHHVDSELNINPIDQHMWGGYQWKADGALKIRKDSSARESKYSSALDSVALGIYNFSGLKAERQKGGLSDDEEFFLDSSQSTVIVTGLVNAAKVVKEEVEAAKESAVEEAEALFNSTKSAPFGVSTLSAAEIQAAFEEAGVTYDSIVGKTERHFNKKVKKADKIVTAYTDLQAKIQSEVEEAFAKEAKLAGEFQEWSGK